MLLSDSGSNAARMILSPSMLNNYTQPWDAKPEWTVTGSARDLAACDLNSCGSLMTTDINPLWKSSIYRINSSRLGLCGFIDLHITCMSWSQVRSMKAEGRHALVLHWLGASWCYMITRLQLLKVSTTKWAVIPRIHQASNNRNIHQGLLMKLRDRRGFRANKGSRHVWFVDVTKSWTLGFVLKWKLAANSILPGIFFLVVGEKGSNQLQGQQRWTVCFTVHYRRTIYCQPEGKTTLERSAVAGVKSEKNHPSLAAYSRLVLLYFTWKKKWLWNKIHKARSKCSPLLTHKDKLPQQQQIVCFKTKIWLKFHTL